MSNRKPRLILASRSPRRAAMLRQVGLQFTIKMPNVKERLPKRVSSSKQVESLAKKLALKKAKSIQKECPNSIILGADTIVKLRKTILGKPKNADDAKKILRKLSGKHHEVITGVAVVFKKQIVQISEKTSVWFERLTSKFIDDYVASGEPLDKAGAYGIQKLGALCVRRIDGDYFNVVGLPLVKTIKILVAAAADRPNRT